MSEMWCPVARRRAGGDLSEMPDRGRAGQPGARGGRPRAEVDDPDDRESARLQVHGPAIGLLITGVLNWIALPIGLVVFGWMTAWGPQTISDGSLIAIAAAGMLVSGLIPVWLGVPVALWATIVLFRHDVREAFVGAGNCDDRHPTTVRSTEGR